MYPIGSNGIPPSFYAGVASIELGDVNEGLKYFKEAYVAHPNHVHVINNLASVYVMNTDVAQGKELYKKALRLNPNFEEARVNLAAIYYNENEIEESWRCVSQLEVTCTQVNYKKFTGAILKKKHEEAFRRLAKGHNQLEVLERFVAVDDFYFKLYEESVKSNQSITNVFTEKLKNRNDSNLYN